MGKDEPAAGRSWHSERRMAQRTIGTEKLCEQGRAAFHRRMWSEAFAGLSEADRVSPLDAPDLDLLADAAHLVGRDVGRDADADEYAARSFRAWIRQGQPRRAARRAAWLGIRLLLRGEEVQAAAWFARGGDALASVDEGPDPERGFLLIPAFLTQLHTGELEVALATAAEIAELGTRFDEPDLVAIGRLGQGQVLAATGRISEAMLRLDEAMLTVTTGEVSPGASGIVYCAVIAECEAVVRSAPGSPVDVGAGPVVQRPAGTGCVPRRLPGAPGPSDAAQRRVVRCCRGGRQRVLPARRSPRRRRGVLPAG